MSITNLLSRLQKVRKRGSNQWMACCPVHDEKTPSMSIKDDNGVILMMCFGCGAKGPEIIQAVGMDISDLFPPKDNYDPEVKQQRKYFSADIVLDCLKKEVLVASLVSKHILDNTSTPELHAELKTATDRIWEASNYIRP